MKYRKYRDVYAQSLLNPTDTELKLDLQQHEDQLDILNITIAREHAKAQVMFINVLKTLKIIKDGQIFTLLFEVKNPILTTTL